MRSSIPCYYDPELAAMIRKREKRESGLPASLLFLGVAALFVVAAILTGGR